MKKGVNWIKIIVKIDTKYLNLLDNTVWLRIRRSLDPSISGIKCDQDKSIFFAERGTQSD